MTQVRLEPTASRSRVKHTNTEPLCSQVLIVLLDSISVPDYNFVLAISVDPGDMPSGSTLLVNVFIYVFPINHFHFSNANTPKVSNRQKSTVG